MLPVSGDVLASLTTAPTVMPSDCPQMFTAYNMLASARETYKRVLEKVRMVAWRIAFRVESDATTPHERVTCKLGGTAVLQCANPRCENEAFFLEPPRPPVFLYSLDTTVVSRCSEGNARLSLLFSAKCSCRKHSRRRAESVYMSQI